MHALPSLTTSRRYQGSWLRTSWHTKSWRSVTRRQRFLRVSLRRWEKKRMRSIVWLQFSRKCTLHPTSQHQRACSQARSKSHHIGQWCLIRGIVAAWWCSQVPREWANRLTQRTKHGANSWRIRSTWGTRVSSEQLPLPTFKRLIS